MYEYQEEDKGSYQLHWNLLAEETDNLLPVPYRAGLVEHKAADEEEHGHTHLQEVVIHRPALERDVPAEGDNVMKHYQYHGETAKGIDILDPAAAFEAGK